jgi:hypothetical protein
MMRTIPLTQGKVTLVDDEDYEMLSQWKWCAQRNRTDFYAVRQIPNPDPNGRRQITLYMHAFLCPAPEGMDTDHINRHGLDNQKANLRPATKPQNSHNRGSQSNNSSGYKGVDCRRGVGQWRARIMVDSKRITLGVFDTAEDAARAYNEAARLHHGEFAFQNLVESAS